MSPGYLDADTLAAGFSDTHLAFMELPGLHATHKARYQQALFLYSEYNLGFGDALLSARALDPGPAAVYAFDRHFARIPGVVHISPE